MESELKFSSDFTSAMFERDADVASAEILPVISCILYTNFLTCCTGKSQTGSFLIPFLKPLDVFVWVFFFVMIRLFALLVSIEMDTVKRNQNCWFDYFTLGFLKLRFLIISYQLHVSKKWMIKSGCDKQNDRKRIPQFYIITHRHNYITN